MGFWIAIAIIVFLCTGGAGLVVRLIEGRRQHRLDLKREEARIAEAHTRERELQQRRDELAYREALLELERFDRRATGPGPPAPPADPLADPRTGPGAHHPPADPEEPPNPA